MEKICINNFTYRRYSFDYFLNSAKELGISNIELSGCHPHFTIYEQKCFDTTSFAKKISDAGIKVPVIEPEQNFLPINIASPNEYLRKSSIEQLLFYVNQAEAFGCNKVIIYPGKNFMDMPYEDSLKLLISSLKEIVDYAAAKNVTILLQNVSENISGMTPDLDTFAKIVDAFGDDRLMLSIDTSAVWAGGNTLDEYFERFGDRIEFIQISDCDEDDEHFELGTGACDIAGFFETMKKHGYEGKYSLHMTMEEYADAPSEPYLASINYLKENGVI